MIAKDSDLLPQNCQNVKIVTSNVVAVVQVIQVFNDMPLHANPEVLEQACTVSRCFTSFGRMIPRLSSVLCFSRLELTYLQWTERFSMHIGNVLFCLHSAMVMATIVMVVAPFGAV